MGILTSLAERFAQDTFGWAWVWGQIVVLYTLFIVFHKKIGKKGP